jgi:hypothetical protein
MGSYTSIRTTCSATSRPNGHVQNEGDIGVSTRRALPDRLRLDRSPSEKSARICWCPSCVSSSHIAFGSIRMEPVFMILGQSAAPVRG